MGEVMSPEVMTCELTVDTKLIDEGLRKASAVVIEHHKKQAALLRRIAIDDEIADIDAHVDRLLRHRHMTYDMRREHDRLVVQRDRLVSARREIAESIGATTEVGGALIGIGCPPATTDVALAQGRRLK